MTHNSGLLFHVKKKLKIDLGVGGSLTVQGAILVDQFRSHKGIRSMGVVAGVYI